MPTLRTEHDALGARDIPADALYGIHTVRAVENFPLSGRRVHPGMIHAYADVKHAAASVNAEGGWLPSTVFEPLTRACEEMAAGSLDAWFPVDALQGGAGTSLNMNVNEVLANRALQHLGLAPGLYGTISPHDHVNLHQSTNDTFPTALRVAALRGLRGLEEAVRALVDTFQEKEHAFAHIVKMGRTEMRDAVLVTLGREMGAYAGVLARDRWRIAKCEERLRVVNLGGTAIGTGLGAPQRYIFAVVDALRGRTGLALARAEDLVDATQNQDALVETSGMLRTLASSLLRICGDLRLLGSGPVAGFGELRLPPRQPGSSIMPGKVNPVIPEAVTQAALQVEADDQTLTRAVGMGSLELNPFLPLVADCLLREVDLLTHACRILRQGCVEDLEADEAACARPLQSPTACATAFVDLLGYDVTEGLVREAEGRGCTLREVVLEQGLLDEAGFDAALSPDRINRLGSR